MRTKNVTRSMVCHEAVGWTRPQQPLLSWQADPCSQPAGHSRSESAWLSCADDASDPQLERPVLILYLSPYIFWQSGGIVSGPRG